jgi:competence protein ComEC
MRRPLIIVLIAWIAGILSGENFTPPLIILVSAAGLIGAGFVFVLKIRRFQIGFLLLVALVFIFGLFDIQKQNYFPDQTPNIADFADGKIITVEGFVTDDSPSETDQETIIIECLRIDDGMRYLPVAGKIKVRVPPKLDFDYGDFVRIRASLKTRQSFNNPGAFDFAKMMRRQGIGAWGYVQDKSAITLLRKKTLGGLRQKMESFRKRIRDLIVRNVSSPQREILLAMSIGAKNAIPDDVREDFNKTGTSHILAISGLHVGMIGAIAFLLFFLLLKSSEYLMLRFNILKVAATGAFFVVLLYAFVAGMGVTVMRAALMAFVFLLAVLFGKHKDLYNVLAIAGLMILAFTPEALWDVSFQLSFVSVLAIIYLAPRLSKYFPAQWESSPAWVKSPLKFIYLTAVVSASAALGTLPLILYYFHRFSFISFLANLIIVPLLGTLTLSVLLLFMACALFWPAAAGFVLMPASFLTSIGLRIIKSMASWNWSSADFPQPGVGEILLFYLFVFVTFQFLEARKEKQGRDNLRPGFFKSSLKYLWFIVLVILAADIVYFSARDRFSSDLKITIIDVGQGSAILARLPQGYHMLIDGGGFAQSTLDVGKAVVAPFLYHERIGKIDTVVLTHPHPDHLLGLIYVMNHFHPRQIWKSALPVDPSQFPQWDETVTSNQIAVFVLSDQSPETIINGVKFKIFWPPHFLGKDPGELSEDEVNDTSLVLKITFGRIRFLVTGDISAEVEKKLVRKSADLASDVLVVPHHGSAYSSSADFIKAVGCRYAVVSAGKFNVFKHPHPSVLERLKKAGAVILRTDQNGAVTFTTDGKTLKTDTFLK